MNFKPKISKTTILFLSCFISVQVFLAQESENNSSLVFNNMPFSILDTTPRYRLGLEYTSNNKLAYSLDVGYGNSLLNGWKSKNEWGDDFNVFEIRPELKYIVGKNNGYNFYLALELFYIDLGVRAKDSRYSPETSSSIVSYQSATLDRVKYGFHIKGGMNIITNKRFNFDLYLGLGFARRIVNYSDVVNPKLEPFAEFNEWFIPNGKYYEGTDSLFHLALGMRFGYALWLSKTHSSMNLNSDNEMH